MSEVQKTPYDNLPDNITRLTSFGWRPDMSADGKEIVFVSKEFGDVFVLNLENNDLRCLTDTICPSQPEHPCFIRASHLSNGDYLLVGMSEWPTDDPTNPMPLYSRAKFMSCS